MKKPLIATTIAVAGFAAFADYAIYNGCDIASLEIACTTNTRVLFGNNNQTWTLSKDASIHSGGFAESGSPGNPKTVTFDFTDGDHTLTLRSGNFLVYNHDVVVDFKGGTWDFNGNLLNLFNSTGGANNRVTLDDCDFINVASTSSSIWLNNTNSYFQLKNGSTLAANAALSAFSGGDCSGSLIEISGGSKMTTKDFAIRSEQNKGAPKAYGGVTFRVTGEGSSFSHGSCSFMFGRGYNGDTFEVTDHAVAQIGYPRLSYQPATRNTGFYVHDYGTLTTANGVGFGSDNSTSGPFVSANGNMYVKVTDGGTFKSGSAGTQDFFMGSENNLLFVSNATFACGTLRVGHIEGATNNVVRVLGKDASFTVVNNLSPLFGNGGQCLVEIGDKANVTLPTVSFDLWNGGADTAYHSPSNVLRVTGGASLTVANGLSVGNAKSDRAVENRVEVTDGATLTVTSMGIIGTNNTFIVSNATFVATKDEGSATTDSSSVNFGTSYNGRSSCNCRMIICGDHPKVLIPKTTLQFSDDSKLRFELPPTGYKYATEGEAPFEIHQIHNNAMDYEFGGLDELQKNLSKSCDIPLIKMTYRMWDGGTAFSAISRINDKLAVTNPGCRLWKQNNRSTTGGEIIYLHVKSRRGLCIILN